MPAGFTESVVEEAVLGWLETLGYAVKHGPEIAFDADGGERTDPGYRDTILQNRLYQALTRLNPSLPEMALGEACRKLLRVEAPNLLARNRALHRMLVDGVDIEYARPDGSIAGAQAQVIDFDKPERNDWLAVNQFTIIEGQENRRPDIVIFVNGLPLGVIELKNPADENATVWAAVQQLENYQTLIPALFTGNAVLVAFDGLQARIGAVDAGKEWFKPWRTISGREDAAPSLAELEVLLAGVFEPRRFLDLLRHFIVFEDAGGGALAKKIAGYHQFHAVAIAVEETLRAANLAREAVEEAGTWFARRSPGGEPGDKRIGVVWHTQGSGKSLTMAFYAGRLILHPAMENPTIVVITDRNDLDDQLFTIFGRCRDLLRQEPVQAESRTDLRKKLRRGAGGVVFTTIQKFMPEEKGDRHPVLSERRNIVVIADEAHRSQYDFIDGLARHLHDALPNASFIGFTGTPIEKTDANTRAVFGDYISVYDIQRAVVDGATVPIYYESRLARLELAPSERPRIDPEFEEVTEGEEIARKEKLKSKWAQLEALVGSEKRVRMIARDLVAHFEERLAAMDGKAMIVCMSRRICVDLYRELVALRPDWQHPDDDKGALKVVMTGSASDPAEWLSHIRNKPRREALANRFRDAADPFRIVIVRDMWLTGFDAPSLHTMYADKPMRGHGLMQAIARVNRVFVERGVSGSKPLDERLEGARLLARLQAGDVVITAKLDHMFRSALNALDMLGLLQKRGVHLHMIDLGGDVMGSGVSKLVFPILSAVAKAERDRTRERIREVKKDQRERRRYLGGIVPFGWRVGPDGELVEDPAQQAAIRRMRALRSEGKSLRAIAAALATEGVRISHEGIKQVLAAQARAAA